MRIRSALVFTTCLACSSASCRSDLTSPVLVLGPLVGVRAYLPSSGLKDVALAPNQSVTLGLYRFDGRDSLPAVTDTWVSRNSLVVSVSGRSATARSAGQAYVVGALSDNGKVFSDSVLIRVQAP